MRDREFASLFFSSQTSLLPEMLFASTCISLANSAGCGIGCLAFIESNLGDSVGGSVNPQKLERMYVAALSRIEAAEPGAETTKSTPIFLRNSDASKKRAIHDAANALGNLWMRKGARFNGPKPLSSASHAEKHAHRSL